MRENLEVTMKMVKSLLLGSAAGIVAFAGAQAADLPVKAKPVEYVKVCSAYGAGFYYIPGTDICLRVGGYVWSEFEVNNLGAGAGNITAGQNQTNGVDSRFTNWTTFRTRFDMVFDARTNTEYGTLRSYASVGWQWTTEPVGQPQTQQPFSPGNYAWYYDRAFIQFAGLTFGYVGSFFDFDPSLVLEQQTSKSFKFTPAIAYTAQLGNGISASISMEDATTRRIAITTGANAGAVIFGYASPSRGIFAGATSNNFILGTGLIGTEISGWNTEMYGGQSMPDFVANLRVDQAWGDAQISGAVHQLRVTNNAYGLGALTFADGTGTSALNVNGPLAPVKYGYAALAGINFKLPMLGAGDSFQMEGAWAKGATDYTGVSANPYSTTQFLARRNTGGVGPSLVLFDSYFNGNGQFLATAYSFNAELRHFWTPTIRSSITYGYNKFKAPIQAQSLQAVAANQIADFPSGTNNQVVANLIWSPVPKLDLGVEGIWGRLSTDCGGLAAANCAADLTRGKSSDYVGGIFRARRDF
jgi:hypothetical protein